MNESMRVLFFYAQEHMVLSLLRGEPDYDHTVQRVDKQEQQLRDLLDSKTKAHFDVLLKEQTGLSYLQEQALFRAGFRLALELMRG